MQKFEFYQKSKFYYNRVNIELRKNHDNIRDRSSKICRLYNF